MEGKYDSLIGKGTLDDIQIAQANELARANELHKLELEIYLAPRKSIRADQPPADHEKIIQETNKQRAEFQKRVQDV